MSATTVTILKTKFWKHSQHPNLGVCRIMKDCPEGKVEVKFVGRKQHIIFPKSVLVPFETFDVEIAMSIPPHAVRKNITAGWRGFMKSTGAIATHNMLTSTYWIGVAQFQNPEDMACCLKFLEEQRKIYRQAVTQQTNALVN